jgi:hypothetical protein
MVKRESAAAIEKAKQDALAREGAIRQEAFKAAELAMAPKLLEAEHAKKAAEERAKEQQEFAEKMKQETAARESAAKDAGRNAAELVMASQLAQAEQATKAAEEGRMKAEEQAKAERQAAEKVKLDAAGKEAAIRSETRQAAEAAMAPKLAEAEQARKAAEQIAKEQREVLEKDKTDAVNAEKAKNFEVQQKLEDQLQKVHRQLQQQTANELGEGAEIDLFEALKEEFPEDQITRVGKGLPGADIIHKVMHNGRLCGCIVYDSKNRNQWRNEYVTKLRQDQLSEKADHAILASHMFPSGVRQLHLQEGVIIGNPARVVALVKMLHNSIVHIHSLRLSNDARKKKTDELYEFITSQRCANVLDRISSLTDDLLELDVKETKTHEANWKKRGELLRAIQRAHGTFIAEVEGITGTAAESSQLL